MVRHFDDLLNVENKREDLEGILPVQGPIEDISWEEGLITQLGMMKKNEACHWTELLSTYRGSKGTWRWRSDMDDRCAEWGNERRNSWEVENKHDNNHTERRPPGMSQLKFRGIKLEPRIEVVGEITRKQIEKIVNISSSRESQRSNHCSAYGCYKKNGEIS